MTDKYYDSIVDLPLNKFIECLVDKNLYALVITGEPEKEQLQKAWDGILMDYNDQMQDGQEKLHFNTLKEYELIKIDLQKIGMCIQILTAEIMFPEVVVPEKRYANDLNLLTDSNFPFDHNDPEQFKKDLKRTENRSKYLLVKIGVKKANLDAINSKANTISAKPTKEYFISILNTLSSTIAKFQLTDSISTYSFCDWVRKYNDYNKFLESQNKQKR